MVGPAWIPPVGGAAAAGALGPPAGAGAPPFVAPAGFGPINPAGLGAHAAPLPAYVPAAAAGGVPVAFAAGALGANDYRDALEKIHFLGGYMTDSRDVGRKLAKFRDYALQRLRQIVVRLQSLGIIAGAAGQAQASLISLIQQINNAGGPTQAQAQAMADLAAEMAQINIPAEIQAVMAEVNNLAGALGATAGAAGPPPVGVAGGAAADVAPFPLAGGRRKRKKGKKTRRKKKKHKGGFKYTRLARSRRSLRMSRRKSLRRQHKKTKKRRRRRRRR
jgi:hypothetical protein